MTLTTDDLTLFDGVESVQYARVTPTGEELLNIPAALRRPVTQSEARLLAPAISLTASDVVWHVGSGPFSAAAPTAGDRIVAGSETWIVLSATESTFRSRWRLYCRKAR